MSTLAKPDAPAGEVSSVESSHAPVLSVRDLRVTERLTGRPIVDGLDMDVYPGETVGIVGESGCGKTTSVLGMLGLLDRERLEVTGTARFMDVDLVSVPDRVRRNYWGQHIGVIYQDALRALNPIMRVGKQIEEVFEAHGGHPHANQEVIRLLGRVGIASPQERRRSYPHELSGGMRQRVMAAIAVAMRPRLLVADEPTTALDVTIQAQVLDLIRDLATESNTGTVIVSHDLGVIAGMCDRVVVLYAGRVAESGRTETVFASPRHPYTRALLRSSPNGAGSRRGQFEFIPGRPPELSTTLVGCAFAERCDSVSAQCSSLTPVLESIEDDHLVACLNSSRLASEPRPKVTPVPDEASRTEHGESCPPAVDLPPGPVKARHDVVLQVEDVTRWYGVGRFMRHSAPPVRAVDGISLSVEAGRCLGLVGESGSGKSTLGRLLVGLEPASSGRLYYDGNDISSMRGRRLRQFRRQAQMIYQDPRSSLNRKYTIGSILQVALRAGGERRGLNSKVAEILDRVGLAPSYAQRYPNDLSGGECQRVAIARALSVRPKVIVADEPVSSLDVSIQGQILNLLAEVQAEREIGIVFIAHDLAVVRELCDTVAVMYLGRIVEHGPASEVLGQPRHPYTVALRSAAPVADPVIERSRERILLLGDPPSPASPPSGCSFHSRCPVGPLAQSGRDICRTALPELIGNGHRTSCHFVDSEVNRELQQVGE